jgi:hypothetical protein
LTHCAFKITTSGRFYISPNWVIFDVFQVKFLVQKKLKQIDILKN